MIVIKFNLLYCPNSLPADTELNNTLQPVLVVACDDPISACPWLLQTITLLYIVLSARHFMMLFLMLNPIIPAYVLYISYASFSDAKDIPTLGTITGGPSLSTTYCEILFRIKNKHYDNTI
jgi:hypothetical protein